MAIVAYPEYDTNFTISILIAALVFWITGFFFAAILMGVLGPIVESINQYLSFALFVALGFGVPFGLGYLASSIGAHGNPSNLESNWIEAIGLILVYASIGAVSAFTGWYILLRRSK